MGRSLSKLGTVICGINRITINGKIFAKKKQLGEGAFSYVDLVQDCTSGEYFALKRIICHDKKVSISSISHSI